MSVKGPERFTGGCLCGSVRIVASGRQYRVGVCHCLDCRKHHGALFHASAIFPQDAVTMYPFDATRTPNAQSRPIPSAGVDREVAELAIVCGSSCLASVPSSVARCMPGTSSRRCPSQGASGPNQP
jgi:hypothetical protein